MASAVDKQPAAARLSAVAAAGCLPTATRGSQNSYTTLWDTTVFGSERLTGALLDRLTHHVHILEMNGESYRLNQSRSRQRPGRWLTQHPDPACPRGSTGPSHARRRVSQVRGTPRRARGPPVDYGDKPPPPSGPFLRRHRGPISLRR